MPAASPSALPSSPLERLGLGVALLAVAGFGMMVQMASCNTILQTLVDDDKRGRVMALYAMTFAGMAPFGSLLAGSLGASLARRRTVLLSGLLCVGAAGVFLLGLPNVQRLSRPSTRREGSLGMWAT